MTPKPVLILYKSMKIILHKDTGELRLAQNIFNETKQDTDSSTCTYPKEACSLAEYPNLKKSCPRTSSFREKLKSARTNEKALVFIQYFVISRRQGGWGGSWLFSFDLKEFSKTYPHNLFLLLASAMMEMILRNPWWIT